MGNDSLVSVFTLSALNATMNQRIALFCLTLLCYSLIQVISITLVLIIILDKSLHEPMYILICVLFMNGLYGTAGFFPHFLSNLLFSVHAISRLGCFIQSVLLHAYPGGDLSILAIMAYDRYLAICRPLQYHSIMTKRKTLILVCLFSITPFVITSINALLAFRLQLCSSVINKLYCVSWIIVKLACPSADTRQNTIFSLAAIFFYTFHGLFIFGSYMHLIKTCMYNLECRKKFMQTCVPHLVSLIIFLAVVLFDLMYMRFGSEDAPQALKNFFSVEFLVIPPVINPLLYGLKLTRIREKLLLYSKIRI